MRQLMNVLGIGILVVGIVFVVYMAMNYTNHSEHDVTINRFETPKVEVPAVETHTAPAGPATQGNP